jgi:O-antigen/teichoic acid export membrane protein
LLILAAILPQIELGLFGISIIVMRLFEQLSETGMRQALIQRSDDIEDYLNTAWASQIFRGVILGLVLFFSAGQIEDFFEKDGVATLLRWLAILPLLQGLVNVGFVYLHRELSFSKIVLHTTVVSLADISLSILFAWLWPVALSLVAAKIVAMGLATLTSFIIEPRRAGIGFSLAHFTALYRFGFWIFVSAILSFLTVNGGDLVIGKLLATESLPIYQIAYSVACLPLMQVTSVLKVTLYSALSRIQNDPPRLKSAFLRSFSLVSMLSAASVAGLAGLGHLFTALFLKEEYALVAQLLPILGVWGGCRALGAINSVFFQATGRPALATIFQVLMVVLFVLILIPATISYEMLGLAWALVGIGTIAQVGRFILLAKHFQFPVSQLLFRLVVPIVIGAFAYYGCCFTLVFAKGLDVWLELLIGLFSLIGIYVVGTFLSESYLEFGVLRFLAENNSLTRKIVDKFSTAKTA